jgi:hypothetical protein
VHVQVWEPSDQSDIMAASDVYTAVGIAHPPGLRFAINIDVGQFEVFASDATGRGLNEAVGELGTATAIVHMHPFGFAVTHTNSAGSVLIHFQPDSKTPGPQSGTGLPPVILPKWNVSDGPPSALSAFGCTSGTFLASSARVGAATVYAIDDDGQVKFVRSAPTGLDGAGPTAGILQPGCQSTTPTAVKASIGGPHSNCGLSIALLDTDFQPTGPAACVRVGSLGITADDVTVAAVSHNVTLLATSQPLPAVTAIALFSVDGTIHCASVTFPTGNATATVIQAEPCDVGTAPSLSVGVDASSGAPVVGATYSGSFCFNTETRNKQSGTASCSQRPVAQGQGISYAVGTIDQWLAQLRAPGTLDSCSTHILRGTLTQGATPQTTVYTHNNHTHLGALHSAGVVADPNSCGLPTLAKNGTMLDAWELPLEWATTV